MEFRILSLGNRGMRCRKEMGPQTGILQCVKAGQRCRGRQGRLRKKATQGVAGQLGWPSSVLTNFVASGKLFPISRLHFPFCEQGCGPTYH